MTTLGLTEYRTPQRPDPTPGADPISRTVLFWVGVADPVLENFRDRLPRIVQQMLACADAGIPHCVSASVQHCCQPMFLRRIRYSGRFLGYGIVIARWETIAPKTNVPAYLSKKAAVAHQVLRQLHLIPSSHLTDRV